MTLGLYGGAFDPPHRGHVELARRAKEELGIDRLLVLVVAVPGHKSVTTPAETRLRLARAAFPDDEVVLDENARTVDTLRAHPEWSDSVFLIGADEFCDFPSWRGAGRGARANAARRRDAPGFPRERLDQVLAQLEQPERVLFFEIEPTPVASSELRARLAAGADVDRGRTVRGRAHHPRGRAVSAAARYTESRLTPIEQARRIAALAQDKLARSVVILDMRPVCTYTDYFVIATGGNARQTKGIWDEVHARLKKEARLLPRSIAGEREATWIIADYLDVVLHVFTPEAREYYRLEELWDDVPHEVDRSRGFVAASGLH